jgi:peptide/nickel transport system substrate-binding protein
MEALYDGPIDTVNYAYQPVILEKIPTLADGDVVMHPVRVEGGDTVVNAAGDVVTLTRGVRVLPAGCIADGCAVEFKGEPLRMDKLEVTFVLRRDVTWADGEPLTADDSVFAFAVASDSATPGDHYRAERTARYYALDERRIKWWGLPGFVEPDYALNFFAPLPCHQLEGRSPAELLQAQETRRAPLGWGPFVVEEWTAGDHIALVRNPHYFRANEGLPYLDRLVFRFAADAADMLARVLSGECDVAVQDAGFVSFLPLLLQSEQQGLLKVVTAPGEQWTQLDFGILPASDYRRVDFFDDARVRQAIAHCIDRRAIVDEVSYGRSVAPEAYLPPGHPLAAGDYLSAWDYDPAAAQALLEQVGWIDENGDSVREAHAIQGIRTGTLFSVTLRVALEDGAAQQAARIVKANLADCGIRVGLETLPAQQLFAPGPAGPLYGRRFDLALTTRPFSPIPACGDYLSSAIPDRGRWTGVNLSGYSDSSYDAACQAALAALPGTAEYDEGHRQAQALFSQDLPGVPLYAALRVAVMRPGVLNFALDPTAASDLWNVEALDVGEGQ